MVPDAYPVLDLVALKIYVSASNDTALIPIADVDLIHTM